MSCVDLCYDHIIHKLSNILGFVSKNQSLFTYNQQTDQSWESFYDPLFQPLFVFNENDLFLSRKCGNNMFCMYDIAVTGNDKIGLSTLNGNNLYDEYVQLSYPGLLLNVQNLIFVSPSTYVAMYMILE